MLTDWAKSNRNEGGGLEQNFVDSGYNIDNIPNIKVEEALSET